MININSKALKPKKYNSLYAMLVVYISTFFLFIQLVKNPYISDAMNQIDYTLSIWLSAFVIILAIFSFIYYRYLCIYILEEKIKDYGILSSLGHSRNEIKKIFLSTLAKSKMIALICGLVIGSLAYYVILLVLNYTLGIETNFFSPQGYVIVCITYFVIYVLNAFSLTKMMNNFSILKMLNYKKQEKPISYPKLFQNLGFITLIIGISLLIYYKSSASYGMANAMLPMLFLTISAYFLMLSFPYWFTKLISKSKSKYLNNLFYISQLRTNYIKYSKLLTACTLIVIFGLTMIILNISFVSSNNDYGFDMPFDFVVTVDDMSDDEITLIEQFENENNSLIADRELIGCTNGTIQWGSDEYDQRINIISEKGYTSLTGNNLNINQAEVVILTQIDRMRTDIGTEFDGDIEWGFIPPGAVSFKIEDDIYQMQNVKEIWEIVYNISDQNKRTYIISDIDYNSVTENLGYYGWKYCLSTVDDSSLASIYEQLQEISSQIEVKETNIKAQSQNKIIVSIVILLLIMLLLFSLVSLMMLRIQQNTKEEKKKYSNLFSLGYTYKQLQVEIKKEMATLFFLPLIIGVIISVPYTLLSMQGVNLHIVIICIFAIFIFSTVEYVLYSIISKSLSKQYIK